MLFEDFRRNGTDVCPDVIHGTSLFQYESSDSCPQANDLELHVTGDLRTMEYKNARCNQQRGYSGMRSFLIDTNILIYINLYNMLTNDHA